MLTWAIENTVMAALLAIVVAGACRVFRDRPAVCHLLWLLVLVRLVAPPISTPHWPPTAVRDAAEYASLRLDESWIAFQARISEDEGRDTSNLDSVMPFRHGTAAPALPAPAGPASVRADSSAPSDEWSASSRDTEKMDAEKKKEEPSEESMAYMERPDASRDRAALLGPAIANPPAPIGSTAASSLAPWLFVWVWMLGSLITMAVQGRRLSRFDRLVQAASDGSPEIVRLVRRVARELGVRPPRVREWRGLESPLVWGVGRPTLLWPDPDSIDADEPGQRSIVAHELAHIRRRDHWIAWIELVALAIFWWNPVLWIARARLRHYADLACDAWVLSVLPQDRRAYAEALVSVVERMSQRLAPGPTPAPALSMGDSSRRQFERRLVMIARERPHCKLSPMLALGSLLVAAVLWPSWAGGAYQEGSRLTVEPYHDYRIDAEVDKSLRAKIECAQAERHANRFFESGDWSDAARAYAIVASARHDDGYAQHRLGMALARSGDLEGARASFQRQAELGHRPDIAMYNLACLAAMESRNDEAFGRFETALRHGFHDAELLEKDEDLNRLRKDARFESVCDEAGETGERVQAMMKAVGDQDWPEVAQRATAVIEQAPEYGEAYHWLGYASIVEGNLHTAREAFSRQSELNHDRGKALYNLACVESRAGSKEAALSYLERSIQNGFMRVDLLKDDSDLDTIRHEPRFAEITRRLVVGAEMDAKAQKALEHGDYEKAAELFGQCAKSDPTAGKSAYHAGVAQFYLGDYASAEASFMQAIERDYNAADSLYNIACCRAKKGDVEGGLAYLDRAVDAGWTNADHMRDDADLAALRSDKRFKQISDRAADENVLEMFGVAHWDHLRARNERLVKREPSNGQYYLGLGWAHLRLGDIEQAIHAFERQGELGFMPHIAKYNIACSYAVSGDRDAALDWLDKAVDAGMTNVEHLDNDPDIDSLRGSFRFEEIMVKARRADAKDHGEYDASKDEKGEDKDHAKPDHKVDH
ncbi:MAG: TPR end-of-group domain-containing protein [Phycisphaerales bacterium]